MIRLISVCAALVTLLALSMSVDAQGRRPSGTTGAGNRPSMGQQRDMGASMRQQAEMRRQEAEAKQQEAEARLAEAEAKRAAAKEHNQSEDMRDEHPPNEHAAVEALLAEENAENQNLRDERPDLQRDNRGDHGHDPEVDGEN